MHPDDTKPIVALTPYYAPSRNGGGSVRALTNLVAALADEFEFWVATGDRDLGSAAPYDADARAALIPRHGRKVLHRMPATAALENFLMVARGRFAGIYLNSFFSPAYTFSALLARRLFRRGTPVVIAPRGEFSPAALRLRHRVKRAYLAAAKTLGLWRDAVWQASSELEAQDIRALIGPAAHVVVAEDIPPRIDLAAYRELREQRCADEASLRVAFVARIAEIKNLHYAIEVLSELRGRVEFDIYGPIENAAYWARCAALIAQAPPHVRINYRGVLANERVIAELTRYDVFFLPTLGENFCYAIVEAMAAGCAILVSDRTPWRNLRDSGIGADLPLSDKAAYVEFLEAQTELTPQQRNARATRIQDLASGILSGDRQLAQARALFGAMYAGRLTIETFQRP